jgi:hypothetical protein
MEDSAEVNRDLVFGLKREPNGKLHARAQGFDLVKLRVAELPVGDKYLQRVFGEFIPSLDILPTVKPRPRRTE